MQEYGLPQVFGQPAPWVGLDNFRDDPRGRLLLDRPVAHAGLLRRQRRPDDGARRGDRPAAEALGKKMRLLVSTSLILAWAMPALTATVVWQWIFDTQYGLVNWALGRQGECWLAEPMSFFVGGDDHRRLDGHPVRRLHRVRRPDPDPRRAARGRPASTAPARRTRSATSSFPALKPILLILTSLSMLWDFRVFTQIYVLQRAGGISRDTNLLGVYAYRISIGENHFDIGRRGRVVMVLITVLLTLVYLRSMMRQERAVTSRPMHAAPPASAPGSTRPGCSSPLSRAVPRVLDGAHVVPARHRHPVRRPVVPAVPRRSTTTARCSSATSSGRRCGTA